MQYRTFLACLVQAAGFSEKNEIFLNIFNFLKGIQDVRKYLAHASHKCKEQVKSWHHCVLKFPRTSVKVT